MARQALTALALAALTSLAGCSSESTPTPTTASSASANVPASTLKVGGPIHRQSARSGAGAARVDASSLPVPEDFESEFRKQITSSNYLDALGSAAAEASAAKRTHP